MALLWAQTSAAKQAEVMTFDGQAVEAVIDVGPRMRGMPTDGTPPVPSMEAVLGNDFRSFGSPVMEPQEEAISTSHISVPLWMQTGQVFDHFSGRLDRVSNHPRQSCLFNPPIQQDHRCAFADLLIFGIQHAAGGDDQAVDLALD